MAYMLVPFQLIYLSKHVILARSFVCSMSCFSIMCRLCPLFGVLLTTVVCEGWESTVKAYVVGAASIRYKYTTRIATALQDIVLAMKLTWDNSFNHFYSCSVS